VGGQGRLSPDDRNATELIPPDGTPGYTIYTLRAGAELIRGFRVFAGVENLSSRDYRVHGSGQNEPGTNAIGGIDWRF
jgi:hemoglobin/transferrin/lactoferrin receptor protein